MNTRTPLQKAPAANVLSVSFNGDYSCFAVGLETGFCIFDAETCQLRTTRDFNAGVGLAQMMGKANYVGLVGGGRRPKFASNKLVIWDDLKSRAALEISALTPVRGVQLSKERIVVVLQNSVRIYKFAKNPQLISAYETANNPWGLCCLGTTKVAFPGRSVGHVQVEELGMDNVSIIPAHASALRAITLSRDGNLVATASETGTLIRIFSTATCAKLVELRRGIDTATIFSLAFNPSSTMLACTSDKATLHIFDVPHTRRPAARPSQPEQDQRPGSSSGPGGQGQGHDGRSRWGILSKLPMMPRVFSDVYSSAQATFSASDDGDDELDDTGAPNPLRSGNSAAAGKSLAHMADSLATLGTATRPIKGVLGWVDEDVLLVVGGGMDARWERFVVREAEDGSKVCRREGWRRYLATPV
ncbi:hypothetical protein VTJ83DRAFT_1473 [Remersonia thermophila]|uniref:Uncharacterized protein n=1 Tax=Remersonia thermophila TaxID=72144 RepID=A0ABR4DG60_9PEZI